MHILHIIKIIKPTLNGPDYIGGTPVQGAAYAGDHKTLQKLIALGADLHKTDRVRGGSVLHIAVESGNLDCIKEIMMHAPELANRPNHDGATPIAWANALNRPDITKVLTGNF